LEVTAKQARAIKGAIMSTITINLTLKQAENLCIMMSKSDPFGIWTGDILRQIDETAKKHIHEMMAEKEKAQ
jgi:hypothetical protein